MNYTKQDPELWSAIEREEKRQQHNIELIAGSPVWPLLLQSAASSRL